MATQLQEPSQSPERKAGNFSQRRVSKFRFCEEPFIGEAAFLRPTPSIQSARAQPREQQEHSQGKRQAHVASEGDPPLVRHSAVLGANP